MGDEPRHGTGPGGVSTQVHVTENMEESQAAIVRELEITSARDENAGRRVQIYGRVCAEEVEYDCAIHHDATNYGPLRGYSTDDRDVGGNKVVGTGGPEPGSSEGGDDGSGRIEGMGRAGER